MSGSKLKPQTHHHIIITHTYFLFFCRQITTKMVWTFTTQFLVDHIERIFLRNLPTQKNEGKNKKFKLIQNHYILLYAALFEYALNYLWNCRALSITTTTSSTEIKTCVRGINFWLLHVYGFVLFCWFSCNKKVCRRTNENGTGTRTRITKNRIQQQSHQKMGIMMKWLSGGHVL